MTSLLDILSQQQPQFQTRKALIVLGLQNDFLSPDGKLPVRLQFGFLERIRHLVPHFREHGEIIWVRSEYRANRAVNDSQGNEDSVVLTRVHQDTAADQSGIDEELFLTQTDTKPACCTPGSTGAEYSPDIVACIDNARDMQIVKTFYSAFRSTNLLLTLRANLITECYFVGCYTNLSLHATAVCAAQHGLSINIIEDCLGYRQPERHDEAIRKMVDQFGAFVTTSSSLISILNGGEEDSQLSSSDTETHDGAGEEATQLDSNHVGHGTDVLAANGSSANDPVAIANHAESYTTPNDAGPAHLQYRDPPAFEAASTINDCTPSRDTSPASEYAPTQRAHDAAEETTTLSNQVSFESGSSRHQPRPRRGFQTDSMPNPSPSPSDMLGARLNDSLHVNKKRYSMELSDELDEPQDSRRPSIDPTAYEQGEMPSYTYKKAKIMHNLTAVPSLGPGDSIGTGDSSVIYDLLPPSSSDLVFQRLMTEVHWQKMYHAAGEVPRLVCCQGSIHSEDGSMPVYRHPSDQSLPLLHWSSNVAKIKREVERKVGHPLNHVLIQLYRGGQDHISEHTDKTLDIVHGSKIVNVSFGAQRTMRLRTKRAQSDTKHGAAEMETEIQSSSQASIRPGPSSSIDPSPSRQTQRVQLPHNSVFVLGHETNSHFLHSIQPDKRMRSDRPPAELAYHSMRISLTFRHIGTFISSDSRKIWGQGATGRGRSEAQPTINGDEKAGAEMIRGFGIENQRTGGEWTDFYDRGTDVLHLKQSLPESERMVLFLSGDTRSDESVRLYMRFLGLEAEELQSPSVPTDDDADWVDADGDPLLRLPQVRRLCLRDSDTCHTQVEGLAAVLLYLKERYGVVRERGKAVQIANELGLLTGRLLDGVDATLGKTEFGDLDEVDLEPFQSLEDGLSMVELDVDNYDAAGSDLPSAGRGDAGVRAGASSSIGGPNQAETQAWLAGEEFGVADCAFYPPVTRLRDALSEEFGTEFPALERWVRRVDDRFCGTADV